MDESANFGVGIDVGTENVRAVVMSQGKDGSLSVIGYNEGANAGMRKGTVANLTGPAEAIDRILGEVERMSGYQVSRAYISINGANVMSAKADGMIALGGVDHEITPDDMERVENAAVVGRVPANRTILDVLPLSYTLDEQDGIKDPMGMTGSRLVMNASVISVLAPTAANLAKVAEVANVGVQKMVPSVVAAARAVLTEKQMENGVAVVDLGSATTSVAVFEEGDLQYVGVIPVGANNVTNDLAIVLQIDTETAEDIKRRFVTASFGDSEKDILVRKGREEMSFPREEVYQVVQDRLREIFLGVKNELKTAHYDHRLPEGIVLVGGGAKMRDLDLFAKEVLEASVRVAAPKGLGGVADAIEKPEYSAAVGLAMMATLEGDAGGAKKTTKKKTGKNNLLKKLFGGF